MLGADNNENLLRAYIPNTYLKGFTYSKSWAKQLGSLSCPHPPHCGAPGGKRREGVSLVCLSDVQKKCLPALGSQSNACVHYWQIPCLLLGASGMLSLRMECGHSPAQNEGEFA